MYKIEISNPECPITFLPTKEALVNLFNKLADLPSKLILLAEKLANEALTEILKQIQDIRDFLDKIAKIIDDFIELETPIFAKIRIPTIEWERRINALIQNFHNYVLKLILNIIDALFPINFTINILGIEIDLLNFLTHPGDEIGKIKAQVIQKAADAIEVVYDLLPRAYKIWGGEYNGIKSPEMMIDAIMRYFKAKMSRGVLGLLYDAFIYLIELFDEIWEALGLPSIVGLLTLDPELIIEDILDAIIVAAKGTIQDVVDAINAISIAGFNLVDIIGGKIESFIKSPLAELDKLIDSIRDFCMNWQKKLILNWMTVVTDFLEAIGLGALLDILTFDFCDFLTLMGFPFTLDIKSEYITITPS